MMARPWRPELHVAVIGILAILVLTGFALYKGVDGVMFGAGMLAIGTIVGWVFKGFTRE